HNIVRAAGGHAVWGYLGALRSAFSDWTRISVASKTDRSTQGTRCLRPTPAKKRRAKRHSCGSACADSFGAHSRLPVASSRHSPHHPHLRTTAEAVRCASNGGVRDLPRHAEPAAVFGFLRLATSPPTPHATSRLSPRTPMCAEQCWCWIPTAVRCWAR